MGIIVDNAQAPEGNDPQPDQPNNQTNGAASTTSPFTGASFTGQAPTGSADTFLNLRGMISLDQADASVEPYLEEVQKQIRTKLKDAKYEKLQKLSNTYAFSWTGPDGYLNFFGILFVSTSEIVAQKMVPASMRMGPMLVELRERYSDQQVRLCDARVIIVGYEPEMALTYQMAATIVRTFNVMSIPEVKNATIESLIGTEFAANWNLTEARKLERMLSPHGVPPRMDFGLTLNAKIQHQFGRALKEFEVDYQPLGVIGGYVEVRAREPFQVNGMTRMLYRPVVMITVCNAVIPLEGVASVLLAAFAPAIYNSLWYATQWSNLGENEPQPGLLEEDPDRPGQPYQLKSKEDIKQFIETYFATPEIAFQFQDGRDQIPNLLRIVDTRPEYKNNFGERITNFFGTQTEDLTNVTLTSIIETRSDGVYGQTNGTLHDSRDIDYLYIAAKNGAASIDQQTRNVLISGSENPTDRANIVSNVTGSFTPLYLNTVAVVNATFIKGLVQMTQSRGLVIVDPNSQMEARPLGSFINGFGSSAGIGSPISSAFTNRGYGLSSVWGFN